MNIPFMISVVNTRVPPHQFLLKWSFTFTILSHLKRVKFTHSLSSLVNVNVKFTYFLIQNSFVKHWKVVAVQFQFSHRTNFGRVVSSKLLLNTERHKFFPAPGTLTMKSHFFYCKGIFQFYLRLSEPCLKMSMIFRVFPSLVDLILGDD